MTDNHPMSRRPMGRFRFMSVFFLLIVIALFEVDWVTTPWWALTQQICGLGGVNGAVGDLLDQIWNLF